MKNVSIESHDSVAILRLTNGVTNSITPEMVVELSEALKQIKSEYKAMVLAGGSKFLCIGLNLPGLLQLDRPAMTEFWHAFDQISIDLYTLPMPTACAIGGHATAGGAIMALACDYRFIASGRKFIGFNEVQIGVPVPYLADLMLRQIVVMGLVRLSSQAPGQSISISRATSTANGMCRSPRAKPPGPTVSPTD